MPAFKGLGPNYSSVGRRVARNRFSARDDEVEGRQEHVHLGPRLVDAVEAALHVGIAPRDMVAVVGELLARGQARGLADNLVALDHLPVPPAVVDDPFASQQGDGAVRGVPDGDIVDERVGLVLRQAHPPVVVHKLVQPGRQAGEFK